MSARSKIEWTDQTWNPVTGCTKLSPASPGCAHCYASTFAERFRGTSGHYFQRGFDLQLRPDKLDEPLHWRKPRLVFVNSMSDLSVGVRAHKARVCPSEALFRCVQHVSGTTRGGSAA
ncbi:MAG: DUF5131 family protein [Mycobacterium sp.]|nr:DUF5131 family protein [Mycobacterium sp.]